MDHGSFQITTKVFLMDGNHLLILKDRASGLADLPGGRITQSELHAPWLNAVHRELREELGSGVQLVVRPRPIFVFPHIILKENKDALGVAFPGRYFGGQIDLSDEHDSLEWINPLVGSPSWAFPPTLEQAMKQFVAWHGRAGGGGPPLS